MLARGPSQGGERRSLAGLAADGAADGRQPVHRRASRAAPLPRDGAADGRQPVHRSDLTGTLSQELSHGKLLGAAGSRAHSRAPLPRARPSSPRCPAAKRGRAARRCRAADGAPARSRARAPRRSPAAAAGRVRSPSLDRSHAAPRPLMTHRVGPRASTRPSATATQAPSPRSARALAQPVRGSRPTSPRGRARRHRWRTFSRSPVARAARWSREWRGFARAQRVGSNAASSSGVSKGAGAPGRGTAIKSPWPSTAR